MKAPVFGYDNIRRNPISLHRETTILNHNLEGAVHPATPGRIVVACRLPSPAICSVELVSSPGYSRQRHKRQEKRCSPHCHLRTQPDSNIYPRDMSIPGRLADIGFQSASRNPPSDENDNSAVSALYSTRALEASIRRDTDIDRATAPMNREMTLLAGNAIVMIR